ncbi:hypothetical protein BHM03_00001317 [Ensete ventricosum]|nr:hypothetical protein BHM03_00001317 [Ensete ventricosum]
MGKLLYVCCIMLLLLQAGLASKTRHFKWEVGYMYASPDCEEKILLGINGQFPGPTVRAKAGDTIHVELKNALHTEGVVIHWHGIRQVEQNWESLLHDELWNLLLCLRSFGFLLGAVTVDQWEGAVQLLAGRTSDGGIERMQVNKQRLCTSCAPCASRQDISAESCKHHLAFISQSGHWRESYSVLITTDQNPSSNYWLSVGVRGRKPNTQPALAIVSYQPNSPSKLPESSPPVTPKWNDYNHSKSFSYKILARQGTPKPPSYADRQIALLNTQNKINGYIKWSINNISLALPPTPYLGSMRYRLKNAFDTSKPPENFPSDYDVMKPPKNPSSAQSSNAYVIQFNSTVDVILQNANALADNVSEIHPWHLHGHDFWVLGYGDGRFEEKDASKFNLENPPLRNTVVIFPYGWTAIRFVADNPGVWAFHCHIEPHLHMGMGVIFAEGVDHVRRIPKEAITCGMTGKMLMNNNLP